MSARTGLPPAPRPGPAPGPATASAPAAAATPAAGPALVSASAAATASGIARAQAAARRAEAGAAGAVRRYRRKRALDLAVTLPLLVIAAPLVALLALLIRRVDGGPALFRQVRRGAGGAPFELLKLRTVAPDRYSDVRWAAPPDGISRLGGVLRRSHLDELPQLVNVVRGEMSLVGPRPERPYFADLFAATVPGYPGRYRMPAGITGAAQLRGLCGDTSLPARVAADNAYIDGWTLRRDLRILAATLGAWRPWR